MEIVREVRDVLPSVLCPVIIEYADNCFERFLEIELKHHRAASVYNRCRVANAFTEKRKAAFNACIPYLPRHTWCGYFSWYCVATLYSALYNDGSRFCNC